MDTQDQRPDAKGRRPSPLGEVVWALYGLFSDPRFAIIIIIAVAIASILGILVVDQVPFRGEVARQHFADRQSDPMVWLLIHVVPAHPFRCLFFRTLLALLSLSLLACVIKRWRHLWRLALTIPWPPANAFGGRGAVVWQTDREPLESDLLDFLKRRLFVVRRRKQDGALTVTAVRFGIAKLGAVFTHLGFLFLVIGGLWMASSGFSTYLWLRPGDRAEIPETDAVIELVDFRIEMTPGGRIADYISEVRLWEGTRLIREMEIEVNTPLRYKGRSLYQSSYRQDPTAVRSVDLVFDAPLDPSESPVGHQVLQDMDRPAEGHPDVDSPMPPHKPVAEVFANPVTVTLRPGERVALENTPYAAAIDTFLVDFRIDGGRIRLASREPRNPAFLVNFFEGDSLIGGTWYFLLHPGMPVGNGPDIAMRVGGYDPVMQTGLELATHPGSAWVWLGIGVMSLGTMLTFFLRRERVWLRVRAREGAWELALLHVGTSPQDPGFARAEWEKSVTSLAVKAVDKWKPPGGSPDRWPGQSQES